MDVLKPETYWIGNRCYRVNPSSNTNQNNYASYPAPGDVDDDKPAKPYVEVDEYEDAPCLENDTADPAEEVEVSKEDNGFKVVCSIPSSLFSNIIGSKGAVKKRIEMETQTRIYVPRQNEKGDIVVRGQTERAVRNAFRRLEQIASNARFRREATHFACFVMNTPAVVEKAKEFKDKVLGECGLNSRGVEPSIFQEPERLHLTICIMFLLDERERRCAADILSSLEPEIKNITAGQKLSVRLKGLEIMNDDPSQVDVLYIKCEPVEQTDALQRIADLIANKFAEKGLGRESKGEKVKLHCTIMNTRYRANGSVGDTGGKQDDNRRRNGYSSRESFDARAVLQKFGSFDFGTVEITSVKIATRHTRDSDGFYKCYTSISL